MVEVVEQDKMSVKSIPKVDPNWPELMTYDAKRSYIKINREKPKWYVHLDSRYRVISLRMRFPTCSLFRLPVTLNYEPSVSGGTKVDILVTFPTDIITFTTPINKMRKKVHCSVCFVSFCFGACQCVVT